MSIGVTIRRNVRKSPIFCSSLCFEWDLSYYTALHSVGRMKPVSLPMESHPIGRRLPDAAHQSQIDGPGGPLLDSLPAVRLRESA